METLISVLGVATFVAGAIWARRWIKSAERDGRETDVLQRRRSLQKIALGAFAFVVAVNVLQITVGDEGLDASGVVFFVAVSLAGVCLIYELRKGASANKT